MVTILMPKNPDTVKFFTRYARFYLQGIMENDKKSELELIKNYYLDLK